MRGQALYIRGKQELSVQLKGRDKIGSIFQSRSSHVQQSAKRVSQGILTNAVRIFHRKSTKMNEGYSRSGVRFVECVIPFLQHSLMQVPVCNVIGRVPKNENSLEAGGNEINPFLIHKQGDIRLTQTLVSEMFAPPLDKPLCAIGL